MSMQLSFDLVRRKYFNFRFIYTHTLRGVFFLIIDNLNLYRTAPDISIFSLLTRVQIVFSSAAAH